MTALPPPPPASTEAPKQVRVKLPPGFSAERHLEKLLATVRKQYGHLGPNWELVRIEGEHAVMQLVVSSAPQMEVVAGDSSTGNVVEAKDAKVSDGPRLAAWIEFTWPGEVMIEFRPAAGFAVRGRLAPDELRCREAVAQVIGAAPWEVRIKTTRNASGEAIRYDLDLPKYFPSKHDKGLLEVAQFIVGHEGWSAATDAMTKRCEFVAGAHFGFSARAISTPSPSALTATADFLGWGERLNQGEPAVAGINFNDHAQVLVAGRAQPLDARIPTPNGWSTIGEMTVGDFVLAADGSVTKVVAFSPITMQQVYEVEFDDGDVVRCSPDHLWTASNRAGRRARVPSDVGPREKRAATFRQTVASLRSSALNLSPHALASAREIASIAGRDASSVGATLKRLGIASTVECRSFSDAYTESVIRSVARYMSIDAFAAVARIVATRTNTSLSALATQLAAAPKVDWLTVREIGRALADDPSETLLGDIRSILRTELVESKTILEQCERVVPERRKNVNVYPAREALLAIAVDVDTAGVTSPNRVAVAPESLTITTAEMAETLRTSTGHTNWAVEACSPADLAEVALPIDPYALGVWLGDGFTSAAMFATGDSAACTDADGVTDREHLTLELERAGLFPHPIRSADKVIGTYGFLVVLREAGLLGNKHIPMAYLRSSFEQRLALLQGLMDSDGTVDEIGRCELCLSDERLVTDALQLIRSLGIKAVVGRYEHSYHHPDDAPGAMRTAKDRHRIPFTTALPVCRLPRKASRLPQAISDRARRHYVVDVRPTDEWVPMRCIRIEHEDHLYLTEGWKPTHNTGAGKLKMIENLVVNAIAAGWKIGIVEAVKNGTDYLPMRGFCEPGWFGVDSLAHAAAVLKLAEREYAARRELLKLHGVQKLSELPPEIRPPRLLIIADEWATLTANDASKGLSASDMKFLPEEMQAAEIARKMKSALVNFGKTTIVSGVKDLAAKARFVGIHCIVATQRGDVASLGSGALRENLAYKVQLGLTSNSPTTLSMTLNAPTDELPTVPRHLMAEDELQRKNGVGGPGWLKGAGFVNADGQSISIAKGWFFDASRLATEDPWRSIAAANLRRGYGEPLSTSQVADLTEIPEPIVRELMGLKVETVVSDDEDDLSQKRKAPKGAHRRSETDLGGDAEGGALGAWEATNPDICASCDRPINPATNRCGCST